MKFRFENLGPLDNTEMELGDLTIVCGKNNTGKTYASYAIYCFLASWHKVIDFEIDESKINSLLKNGVFNIRLQSLEKSIPGALDQLSKGYSKSLPYFFGGGEDSFSEASFRASISDCQPDYADAFQASRGTKEKEVLIASKEKNSSILRITMLVEDEDLIPPASFIERFLNDCLAKVFLENYFSTPFIITSERSGISLFHKQLGVDKNVQEELERFVKYRESKTELETATYVKMFNDNVSRYTIPVQLGIDFVRDIADIYSKKKSPLIKEHPELLTILREMAGGDYTIENAQIYFRFDESGGVIPLTLSSSTVKSQLDLNFYLGCLAKKGDILMIDEPELNLHPANQRKMARLFVRLIKAGIKVFVTTHSDYIIKELNNLIILSSEFESREKAMKKYNYTEEDALDKNRVKAYITQNHSLVPAPVDEFGIEMSSFDDEIIEMDRMFDDMTVTMDNAYG
ncbi:MAG: ATP-binding protein [Gammaproteobacteria bacterium]|nr:ATP-binding protein [Gammaproteobacteria bacterium]